MLLLFNLYKSLYSWWCFGVVMVKKINISIQNWLYEQIEKRKKLKQVSRSETISELINLGLKEVDSE